MDTVEFLKMIRLRQYPARRRTMIVRPVIHFFELELRPVQYVPFDCPCLSFGEGTYFPPHGLMKAHYFFVWRHSQPWKSLEEVVDMMYTLPIDHHTGYNSVCLGKVAREKVVRGELTPEEAFWGTTTKMDVNRIPFISDCWDQYKRPHVNIEWLAESEKWMPFRVQGNVNQTVPGGSG
jgi:hypothetical protein